MPSIGALHSSIFFFLFLHLIIIKGITLTEPTSYHTLVLVESSWGILDSLDRVDLPSQAKLRPMISTLITIYNLSCNIFQMGHQCYATSSRVHEDMLSSPTQL